LSFQIHNNPTKQQNNNPTIQQSNKTTIQQSNNPTKKNNNPTKQITQMTQELAHLKLEHAQFQQTYRYYKQEHAITTRQLMDVQRGMAPHIWSDAEFDEDDLTALELRFNQTIMDLSILLIEYKGAIVQNTLHMYALEECSLLQNAPIRFLRKAYVMDLFRDVNTNQMDEQFELNIAGLPSALAEKVVSYFPYEAKVFLLLHGQSLYQRISPYLAQMNEATLKLYYGKMKPDLHRLRVVCNSMPFEDNCGPNCIARRHLIIMALNHMVLHNTELAFKWLSIVMITR